MATFYIDPSAQINGSGTFANPYNVPPTFVSGNAYLFKAGTIFSGRTSTWVINLANFTLGTYDVVTGDRVTDGSQWATFDFRNRLLASSSALSLGANCATGLDIQGLVIKAGWFVNHNGVTYQCILNHTSSSTDEPGIGASWVTTWIAYETYLEDSPAWTVGTAYQRNNGSCISANIAMTSPVIKHIRTVGCAIGLTMNNVANITDPHVEDLISTMCWGSTSIPIGGSSASPMTNPILRNIYANDCFGLGIAYSYITGSGSGMVIENTGATQCKASGVTFRYVKGAHSIRNIDSTHNRGSNVIVDSGCESLILDGVIGDYASDNGFSGVDAISPGHPPTNCEIRNFRFLYCGDKDYYTADPASDGDGFSCHAGTGWVFDTGISCHNLNSGAAQTGGATGKILNSVITKNGYQADGTVSPAKYTRGGVALLNSGLWTIENSIVEDNYPYDFKLTSPSLLAADTNLIYSVLGRFTTDFFNNLDLDGFVAAVTAGGGSCTNITTQSAAIDTINGYRPSRPGSAAIGAGKGCGIGLAGVDFDGNERPAPDGDYSLGPFEDYPPPKEGFGPWVHFDGTLTPPVALATSAVGTVERVFTYTGELSISKIEKLATTPEKFDLLSNEDWNNLADKDW